MHDEQATPGLVEATLENFEPMVLHLEPNDVLVYQTPHRLSGPAASVLVEMHRRAFGDRKAIILEGGVTLTVARTSED